MPTTLSSADRGDQAAPGIEASPQTLRMERLYRRLAAEGFIGYVSTRLSDVPVRVTSERPDPDRILFQIGG